MSRFPPTLKRAFEIKALLPSLQRTLEILFFRNVCLSQIEYICLQTPPLFSCLVTKLIPYISFS